MLKIAFILTLGINMFCLNGSSKPEVTVSLENLKIMQDDTKVYLALKEALSIGVKTGVKKLSKKDGFLKDQEVKITFPDELKKVEETLDGLGLSSLTDDLVVSMNRAAEQAVSEAQDLFIEAIKSMTIEDALKILNGPEDAATRYLELETRDSLYIRFKPIVSNALVKTNSPEYWKRTFDTYNKVPFVRKVNPDQVDYVTNKTLDGLFIQIAKQEKNIRINSAARVTDLLKEVFGRK